MPILNVDTTKLIIVFIFTFLFSSLYAQPPSDTVTAVNTAGYIQKFVRVNGFVVDTENNLPITSLMVINKRTNNGSFSDSDGKFSVIIEYKDTLVLSALGFKAQLFSLKDSVFKSEYNVQIQLSKLEYTLKEVVVFPIKSLNEIQRDIDKLGVKRTYAFTPVDAFQSPISYLYDRFSKFSKSKRKVAELESEDLKREILKDMFRLYIKYDIIDLDDVQFDAFIRYLNFSDSFMKNATQLELILAIKGKYESFKYRWQ